MNLAYLLLWVPTSHSGLPSWRTKPGSCWAWTDGLLSPSPSQSVRSEARPCGRSEAGLRGCRIYPGRGPDRGDPCGRDWPWGKPSWGRTVAWRTQTVACWSSPPRGSGRLFSGRLWSAPASPVWGWFSEDVTPPHSAHLWETGRSLIKRKFQSCWCATVLWLDSEEEMMGKKMWTWINSPLAPVISV